MRMTVPHLIIFLNVGLLSRKNFLGVKSILCVCVSVLRNRVCN